MYLYSPSRGYDFNVLMRLFFRKKAKFASLATFLSLGFTRLAMKVCPR